MDSRKSSRVCVLPPFTCGSGNSRNGKTVGYACKSTTPLLVSPRTHRCALKSNSKSEMSMPSRTSSVFPRYMPSLETGVAFEIRFSFGIYVSTIHPNGCMVLSAPYFSPVIARCGFLPFAQSIMLISLMTCAIQGPVSSGQ